MMAQEYRAKGAPKPKPKRERSSGKGPHKYRFVFHGPPVTAPGGSVPFTIPEQFADDLARHLESTGFYSHADLVEMAGPDGMLDVSTLPGPSLRQDPPVSGPRVWGNFGPWVPVSSPAPAAAAAEVDLDDLTDEQADAMRVESEAVQEGLRRRERNRARLAEADPHVRDCKPGDGDLGGGTA